jgi:hypothetical protein
VGDRGGAAGKLTVLRAGRRVRALALPGIQGLFIVSRVRAIPAEVFMTNTTALQLLPLIQPSQAQKHVTYNEAVTALDVLVQTSAISRVLTAPPVGVVQGACHIVADGATGDWLGKDRQVAVYGGTFWTFYQPRTGWRVWLESEVTEAVFDGAVWTTSADRPERVAQLGVSATPDDTNRLTVSADATLLTNAGAGHQLKINKAHGGDTASLLFQTGFSGRAEMGNVGNDDFVLKVSANGTTFLTGLTIEAATGKVLASHGINIVPGAGDPASPVNGDVWYNATIGRLRARQGGRSVDLFDPVFSDAEFRLQDEGDATKQAVFQVAGISTGMTRTLSVPNASGTIALTGDSIAAAQISDSTAAGRAVLTASDAAAQRTALAAEGTGNKGAVNGYAGLDGSARVPVAQLPAFMDLSSTQTIGGGKTFTGPVTFNGAAVIVDANLTLQDDVDSTKRATFQLGGITTGNSLTYALPGSTTGSYNLCSTSTGHTIGATWAFSAANNTFGNSTAAGTIGLAVGATVSGSTKAVNIGTGGAAGSSTTIVIGPAAGAGTVAVAPGVTSFSLSDSAFTLQDNGDATKQVKFEVGGLTSGTTRTLSVPDASGTLALNTVFGAAANGLTPASGGGSANFLRADGSWQVPVPAYPALTAIPAAIDAIDGLTPAADAMAFYTGTTTAALTPLTGFGRSLIDDADAATARATLERQDFATRTAFVSWATGRTPVTGHVMKAEGYLYRYTGAGAAISDLPGWVPHGTPTALHWGADITGSVSAIPAVAAMLDYVNGLGGGLALMPAGTYLWAGQLIRQGLNKVILEGEGNVTRIVRTGNRTAAAIRFWGGSNNRIRRILIDCAGYAGRGFYLGDQFSGIEDCECNNCPDRPFGMQGGGGAVYGLDSAGRTSDDAGFTTATFFPVGCYVENCRATRSGNTAISQKMMPHSRIQRCTVQNSYSEGITVDRCDYSVVSSNTLLNVALIDTSQFPDLDAGTGFLSAGGGGVGGIGIDGSTGARVTKNTIIGVQSNLATRNNRNRVAINFVNNIQAANGCQIEGNYISDAKAGVWLKGTGSGAAGNNFRHVIAGNVFDSIGTGAGTGIPQFGAVWIDAGCTDNVVQANTQIGGVPLVTGASSANIIDQMAANSLKGNNTGSLAAGLDLTGTQVTAMLDTFSSSAKGLAPASPGGAGTFLRGGKPGGHLDPDPVQRRGRFWRRCGPDLEQDDQHPGSDRDRHRHRVGRDHDRACGPGGGQSAPLCQIHRGLGGAQDQGRFGS